MSRTFVILVSLAALVTFLRPSPPAVLAESTTQTAAPGCKTLFMVDNQNGLAQLYATSLDDPNTVQLYQTKNLNAFPRELRLIQLRSGSFGLIYLERNEAQNKSVIRYTTFDPVRPNSIVYEAPDGWRAHFADVVELSDDTFIAVVSYNKDTEEGRLTGPKSKCFDGQAGSKRFCTQDARAGIFKSTDQGRTWSRVTSLDNDDIYAVVDRRGSFFHPSLAVGPNDHLYLLVVEQFFDPRHSPTSISLKRDTETLWKSVNRGVSWTRVNNVFTGPFVETPPHYQANEGDLTVEPNGRIVVTFSTNYHPGADVAGHEQGDYLLVTSSSDDGATWTQPKIVGKFGSNKGAESMPSLQLVNGNRYGIKFRKISDPASSYSYVFSQTNSLSSWTSAYAVDPPDSGNPDINPVCVQNKNVSSSPTPSPAAISADLTDEGDTPGDQVNIFDYNLLVSGFGTEYDIFDYNILVENFSK